MKYEILCFDDFLEVRTYGDAELKVFKDFIRAIYTEEHWHSSGAILINHLELNAATITTDELREMAEFNKKIQSQMGRRAKVAILAARDLEFGLGRMWQVFASQGSESSREIFRSRDKAISWLKEE